MRRLMTAVVTTGAVAAALAVVPAAGAAAAENAKPTGERIGGAHAVFVQTNDPAGNAILAFHRAADGSLTPAGTYPTGGLGGAEVSAPFDALASQGSLVYDDAHALLLAVNAGSDTVSVFSVSGDHLDRRQVVASNGEFPVSLTVEGDLAYVLNAGGDGSVSGFRITDRRLAPIAGTTRTLDLGNTTPPLFISAPAQVGLNPAGTKLVVTTKNHNTIDVFSVSRSGRLSATPTVTTSAGPVPFAFAFDARGRVLVTEAGTGTVTSYRIRSGGELVARHTSEPNGQAALCWIQGNGRYVYGANSGSSTISSYRVGRGGTVSLVQVVAATTDTAPIDIDATEDGRYLYSINAIDGTVQGFRTEADGTLTAVARVSGLIAFDGNGMEGLVAL